MLNEALITFDLEKQKSSSQSASDQASSSSSSSSSSSESGESGSPLDNTASFPGGSESAASAGQPGEQSPWDTTEEAPSGAEESSGYEGASGPEGWEDTAMGPAEGGQGESDGSLSEYGEAGAAGQGTAAGAAGSAGDGQDNGGLSGGGRQVVIIGGGSQGQAGMDEDTGAAGGGSGTETLPGGARTDAERIVILEGRLDDQLEEFDGMILSERRAVIQENNKEGSTPGSGGNGYGEGEGEGGTAPLLTAMSKGSKSNAGGGMMPSQPGDNRQGDFDNVQATTAVIPPDIPDGSDDDVVARQLREAAMKETDPRLREKLWDEYRKYKQGAVGKK